VRRAQRLQALLWSGVTLLVVMAILAPVADWVAL
jgi:hypothetical protein